MEQVTSVFNFSTTYVDNNWHNTKATVILTINYSQKTFNIQPSDAALGCGFVFEFASHKYKKWLAELKSINDAIEFAVKELKL